MLALGIVLQQGHQSIEHPSLLGLTMFVLPHIPYAICKRYDHVLLSMWWDPGSEPYLPLKKVVMHCMLAAFADFTYVKLPNLDEGIAEPLRLTRDQIFWDRLRALFMFGMVVLWWGSFMPIYRLSRRVTYM